MINSIKKIWYYLICIINYCWVYILRKDPIIHSFTNLPAIAVIKNPLLVSWKVSGSWKVEIEGIGMVKKRGTVFFKNKNSLGQLKLFAYGRNKKIVTKTLDLNLKKIPHFLAPGFIQSTFSQPFFRPPVAHLSKEIYSSLKDLSSVFYALQDNHDLVHLLDTVIAPERINSPTDGLLDSIDQLVVDQQTWYEAHFKIELNYHLQTQI